MRAWGWQPQVWVLLRECALSVSTKPATHAGYKPFSASVLLQQHIKPQTRELEVNVRKAEIIEIEAIFRCQPTLLNVQTDGYFYEPKS